MRHYIIKCTCCDKEKDIRKTIAFEEALFENGVFNCCYECYKFYNENRYNKIHLSWYDKQKLKELRDKKLTIEDLYKLYVDVKFEI